MSLKDEKYTFCLHVSWCRPKALQRKLYVVLTYTETCLINNLVIGIVNYFTCTVFLAL